MKIKNIIFIFIAVVITFGCFQAGQIVGEKMISNPNITVVEDSGSSKDFFSDENSDYTPEFYDSDPSIPVVTELSPAAYSSIIKVDKTGKTSEKIKLRYQKTIIIIEKGCSGSTVDELINDVKNLHPNLVKCIKTITLTPELIQKKFSLDLSDEVLVRGLSDGNNIYLNDELYRDYALIHESFHNVDYILGTKDGTFRDSKEFTDLWNNYVVPNDYPEFWLYYVSDKSKGEYFASMGQVWYMNPDWVKKHDITLYTFFEENFGEIFKGRYDSYDLKFLNYDKLTGKWDK